MGGKRTVLWVLLLGQLCETSLGGDQCPDSCYCDGKNEYAICHGEDGAWGGLPNVPNTSIRVELKAYDVKVLSPGDLEGLEALQELKLQQSKLEKIEGGTFAKLKGLTKLDLSENSLVNITGEAFQGLHNLRNLDLSSNRLLHIEEAFISLSKVEQLNLRSNRLFKLTNHTFIGLNNLRYLDLGSNNISDVEIETFRRLDKLAHVILSNNLLVTLRTLDFSSPRLQYMDISHSSLVQMPTNLSKFVKDLRLAKNNITRIKKDDFNNYPYIELLVLDDNMIVEIEDGTWARHQYLLRIWINGNSLVKIPSDLPSSLRDLFIEENSITDIPNGSFKGLVNLERLYLQRNNIQNISLCGFCGLKNLKTLDVQANFVQTIPEGLFSELTALEDLDLSQNNIQKMEGGCFIGLQRLSKLHISRMNNDISFNENTFDSLKNLQTLEMYDSSKLARRVLNSSHALRSLRNLQTLNLVRNDISQLREDFQSFFPNLRELKISENVWNCVPGIVWLSKWMEASPSMFIDAQNVVCSNPAKLKGTPLMSLTKEYPNTEYQTDGTSTGPFSGLTTAFSINPEEAYTAQLLDKNRTSESHYERHLNATDSKIPSTVTLTDEVGTDPTEKVTESAKTFTEYLISSPPLLNGIVQTTSEPPIDVTNTTSANAVSKMILSKPKTKWTSYVILISCLVSLCVILLSAILVGFAVYKRNKKHQPGTYNGSVGSSIAYCPCRDEVLTAFELANESDGVRHGVGNKLYYALNNS